MIGPLRNMAMKSPQTEVVRTERSSQATHDITASTLTPIKVLKSRRPGLGYKGTDARLMF